MAISNGILSVGIATIICTFISFFLYNKNRDRMMVIYNFIFCFGVYTWIVYNFFPLPLSLSYWKDMVLRPVDNWKGSIVLVPFNEIFDMFSRFGINAMTMRVLVKIYVNMAAAPLMMGFSIKGAYKKLKKVQIMIIMLVSAFIPFLVHSSFIVIGKQVWKRVDITTTLFFILYFYIGYGVYLLIKKLRS